MHHRRQQLLLRFKMPKQRHLIATRPLGDPPRGRRINSLLSKFFPRRRDQPPMRRTSGSGLLFQTRRGHAVNFCK
jgi:hypothetical protein